MKNYRVSDAKKTIYVYTNATAKEKEDISFLAKANGYKVVFTTAKPKIKKKVKKGESTSPQKDAIIQALNDNGLSELVEEFLTNCDGSKNHLDANDNVKRNSYQYALSVLKKNDKAKKAIKDIIKK